ncbi:hypothetical protein ACNOYE_15005 [Nannocystaceae bacterium ST9]
MIARREWLVGGLGMLGMAGLGLAGSSSAAPPVAEPEQTPEQRRLANRLELWTAYAKRTDNLVARYTSERISSLLQQPLVNSGQLAFVAPGTLVLRDDGATGSITRIGPGVLEVRPNDPSLPQRRLLDEQGKATPALQWLADRLLACFAPGDGSQLIADARTEVPRGALPRLIILPRRGSAARMVLRSVTLTLDPVGGAIQRIVIAEADGGEFRLALVEPQQNVEPEALARVLDDPR